MGTGPGEILRLIRTGEATTRADLVDATGLSRVTIAQRLDLLLEAGVIRVSSTRQSTRGRRAERFAFDPRRSLVLTTALDMDHAALAVVDPHGRVLHRDRVTCDVQDGPAVVLGRILDGLAALLERESIPSEEVGAVALSAPGPVDPLTHRLNEPPIMPGWNGWPLIETIADRFDVPVWIENDADAMAYGEHVARGGGDEPIVFVKASGFIGAGVVIGGRIFRGTDGGSGDIGHVQVGGQHLCRCGRVGCLAAEASGAAVLRQLEEQGTAVRAIHDIVALAQQGDDAATAAVARSGELIGTVLAMIVGVLNPRAFVIGGELASPSLIAAIRSRVYAGSLPRATRHLEVVPARLGGDAALIGLAHVAITDMYSVDSVDRRFDA